MGERRWKSYVDLSLAQHSPIQEEKLDVSQRPTNNKQQTTTTPPTTTTTTTTMTAVTHINAAGFVMNQESGFLYTRH